MAKSSQVVPVRMSKALVDEMREQIAMSNEYRKDEPWTCSSFIVTAVREKLAKMARSRKGRIKVHVNGQDASEGQ